MSAENSHMLETNVDTSQIKVYSMTHLYPRLFLSKVDSQVQKAIKEISTYFASKHMKVEQFDTKNFYYLPEVTNMIINHNVDFPYFLSEESNFNGRSTTKDVKHSHWIMEFIKAEFCSSKYTFSNIWFEMMVSNKGYIMPWSAKKYRFEAERLEKEMKVWNKLYYKQ